jgi:hypothetical protein
MESERLTYSELQQSHLDVFHTLVQDVHVCRYLMDGQTFPREWSAERIRDSQSLFKRRGVGVWLVNEKLTKDLIGFCGFVEMRRDVIMGMSSIVCCLTPAASEKTDRGSTSI